MAMDMLMEAPKVHRWIMPTACGAGTVSYQAPHLDQGGAGEFCMQAGVYPVGRTSDSADRPGIFLTTYGHIFL